MTPLSFTCLIRAFGLFLTLGTGCLNFSGSLQAGEILRESFSAPEGGLPEGWMARRGGEPESAEIREDAKGFGPGLFLYRSRAGSGNSVVFLGTEENERRFANCSGTVVIITNTRWSGIILRAIKRQYSKFEGYFIALNPTKEGRALQISYSPDSHVNHGEILTSKPLPFDVSNEPLVMKFSATGSLIQASLFRWNNGAPDFQSPIAAVQVDDAMIDEGSFGFRSAFGNSGWVVWKDLELDIQP